MKKQLFFLVSLLLIGVVMVHPVYSVTPILYVSPSSIIDTNKSAGTTFTVNIDVRDVVDLYGFDIKLNYTSSVLTATQVALGSFFPQDALIVNQELDDTIGRVRYMVTLPLGTPQGSGLEGSGTLATITFSVDSLGGSRLDLYDTQLGDSYSNLIPHQAYDGYFGNSPGSPKLYVYPDAQGLISPDLTPGKNVTIELKVSDVTDLYTSKLKLSYNPALLKAVEVSEGDFLKGIGTTSFTSSMNETEGSLQVNLTLVGPTAGAEGDGTLSKITFNIQAVGECILHLYDTELSDSTGAQIAHGTVDGHFSNRPIIHDIAVTKVDTVISSTKTVDNVVIPVTQPISEIQSGKHVNVTVTIKNNGTVTETVDVTAYCDDARIGTKNDTVLSEGTSITLVFDWNTEGVSAGNHLISAQASTIVGETNTVNNRFVRAGNFAVLASGLSIPLELVLAAVVIIVIVALMAVYFLKIRKPKSNGTEFQKP